MDEPEYATRQPETSIDLREGANRGECPATRDGRREIVLSWNITNARFTAEARRRGAEWWKSSRCDDRAASSGATWDDIHATGERTVPPAVTRAGPPQRGRPYLPETNSGNRSKSFVPAKIAAPGALRRRIRPIPSGINTD